MIELIINKSGEIQKFDIPNDVGINLMELLKGEKYESIEGTCGGLALCATCHITVLNAEPSLSHPSIDELYMLETLPLVFENSRLGCQIKLDHNIHKLSIKIIEN